MPPITIRAGGSWKQWVRDLQRDARFDNDREFLDQFLGIDKIVDHEDGTLTVVTNIEHLPQLLSTYYGATIVRTWKFENLIISQE